MAEELRESLDRLLEARARAIADLAYLKARAPVTAMNRLAKNKALYFIACGDAVKIGMSSHPEDRLDRIAVGAPGKLRLLAKIPNMGHRESECHRRLKHLHTRGEWFRYTEEVDALISGLRKASKGQENR